MALITEDGTGKADAESYASVSDADAYMAARGNTAWAALSTGDKEINLRKATDYMVGTYREQWAGLRVSSTQALDWPRFGVPVKDLPGGFGHGQAYFSSTAIPQEVKTACIILALKARTGELAPDLGPQKQSVKVGPIETTYAVGARQTKRYQAAETLLAPYFGGMAGMVRVVRA